MATTMPKAGEQVDRVELLLAQLDTLPTLPAVAMQLLELTTASNSSAREVVRLVESDQSLAAKILSMTRRASTGAGSAATTIDRAVILLGFEAVRNACLSIKVFEVFARRGEPIDTQFDRTEFWKHSLAVACGAQLAAKHLSDRVEPEHAFVCGLLHDMGKVALDTCLPKSFDRVVRRVNSQRGCIADVEREILGVDHTIVGHRLAQRWRLPASITECIWLHHQGPDALPATVEHADLVRLVHFADRLAREQRIGYSGNYHKGMTAAALAERIGLNVKAFEQISGDLAKRIEERAQLIGLDRLTSQDLYMKALSDANDELSRINLAMSEANRRLATRSRYFNALNGMNQQLVNALTHGEVCAAAATAVRASLDVPAAAVYLHSSATRLIHVGTCRKGDPDVVRSITWDASGGIQAPTALSPSVGQATFLPSAAAAASLTERIQADLGTPLPWFCSVLSQTGCSAGILLSGDAGAASAWAQEGEELSAMLTAIRLWLSGLESQQQAQRLNEGLTDVNRRLVEAQDEAARMRSLSMIAEMAAGAAHELNNPLAVISGRSQMLKNSPPDEATARTAAVLAEQSQRCSEIVAELMDFAKPAPPERRRVNVGTLLERARDEWLERSSMTPDQFVLELSDDVPEIDVDPGQVKMAIDELVRNSVDAMTNRERRLVVNCQWEQADERVAIRVEDTGCGMSPATLERAMDPFFSSRPAGRGRGLGLSRAARWIEINGGRLRIDSRENEGTTVFIEFPVIARATGR